MSRAILPARGFLPILVISENLWREVRMSSNWTLTKLKQTAQITRTARYHFLQKKLARNALQQIEADQGKTDKKLIRHCNSYAREVLGWNGYAPWLWVYTALAGSFREGWIPDNYYGKVVVPRRQGAYGRVSHLKAFHAQIFRNGHFPDIAYCANDFFISPDYTILSPAALEELLFNGREEVVFKKDLSYQGRGIQFLDQEGFRRLQTPSLGNGVFQEVVHPHPVLETLSPGAVATLRLTTVLNDDGLVSLRAAYLRLGRSNDRYVRSASQLRIPISLHSGELLQTGYFPSWRATHTHPDTRVSFLGKTLPRYRQCAELVCKLHEKLPLTRCVGWDLTVDRDEKVQILEWNGADNDIKFSEATQGPCFADLGWERLWQQ